MKLLAEPLDSTGVWEALCKNGVVIRHESTCWLIERSGFTTIICPTFEIAVHHANDIYLGGNNEAIS